MTFNYPYAHANAKYRLKQNNLRIMDSSKRILFEYPPLPKNIPSYFNIRTIEPKLKIGQFEKSKYTKQLYHYSDLKEYGFIIKSRPVKASERKFGHQKKIRSIRPIQEDDEYTLKAIPKEHKILFDPVDIKFLLHGPTSDNQWTKPKRVEKKEKEKSKYISDLIYENLGFIPEESAKFKKIKGLPMGICHEMNKLVCIPDWKDPPITGCVGKRGSSKSWGLHLYQDLLFHYKGVHCCNLNDWKMETFPWSMPMEGKEEIAILNHINLNPTPLPTVYFTPESALKNKEKFMLGKEEGIGKLISLPFEEVIARYNSFFSPFEEFRLGQSRKIFNINKIKECKTEEEVINSIEEIGEKGDKSYEPMRKKLRNTMNFLFEQEVCDISSKSSSKYKVQRMEGNKVLGTTEYVNPLIATMIAGLYPIFLPRTLESINLGNTSILPSYIDHLVQVMYDIKDNTKYLKKELHFALDELETITSKRASPGVSRWASLGRSSGIGGAWANQVYSNALKIVRDNTDYLLSMQQVSQTEINKIVSDRDAKAYVKDELKQLSQKIPHECFIFPFSHLLTYDLSTGQEEKVEEAMRIQLFSPLSNHLKPND